MNDKTDKILFEYFGRSAEIPQKTEAALSIRLLKEEIAQTRRLMLLAVLVIAVSSFALFVLVLVFAGTFIALTLAGGYLILSLLFSGALAAASVKMRTSRIVALMSQ